MKKNILVNFLGSKGAGPLYSIEAAKHLIKKDLKVYVLIPESIENFSDWTKHGFEIIIVENYQGLLNKFLLFIKLIFKSELKKKLCKLEIDIIYIPMLGPFSLFVNNIFKNSLKITTLHDPIPHPRSNKLVNFLNDIVCNNSDYIIVLSKNFIDYCSNKFKLKQSQIIHLAHPVFDTSKFYNNKEYKFNFNKKFNFMFFGRIEDYKGIEVFLNSVILLQNNYDNFSISLIGSGNLNKYKHLINKIRNIDICNEWIPNDEIEGFFKRKNTITVLPYTSGTQSGIIPISMLSNSLIISSKIIGLVDQLNGHGVLFNTNDSNDLSNKMELILQEKINITEITKKAKTYVKTQTWDKMIDKLLNKIKI